MIAGPAARKAAYDPACPIAVKKPTIRAAYIQDQPRACIATARKLNMASDEIGTPIAIRRKPPPRNVTEGIQAVVTASRPMGLTFEFALFSSGCDALSGALAVPGEHAGNPGEDPRAEK
ncbi:MAG: hypothetical protein ACM3ZU_02000 [Bacteroidota bacterium]